MDKHTIIGLKLKGYSNSEIAKQLRFNRKTVAKYWNEYKKLQQELSEGKVDPRIIQEKMAAKPKYNSSNKKS